MGLIRCRMRLEGVVAKSKNLVSGQFPTVGTSDAASATAAPVRGATPTAKAGVNKSKDPVIEPHTPRTHVTETSGAQYAVTVARAYPGRAEGIGRNVHLMPASHTQGSSFRTAVDEFEAGFAR